MHHHTIQINHQPDATVFQFIILTFIYSSTWPRTQHGHHHDTKVKPEAATAVTELLMTGRRTPETCWAVNKRQDNKLENCCIWLVIWIETSLGFYCGALQCRLLSYSNLPFLIVLELFCSKFQYKSVYGFVYYNSLPFVVSQLLIW